MKRLFHLSTTSKYLEWFEDDWDRIKAFKEKHQMDGIELGLTEDYDISKIPEGLIEGVHLKFYPMWLDFWRKDVEKVKQLLGTEENVVQYYGGLEPEILVQTFKNQFRKAKALKAKYMVFHVCHIRTEDSFTFDFDYTSEEVMNATLELVNQVFTKEDDGPMLLFENLWWPGLTYTDPKLTKAFINGVDYPHKGFVLDVSHLILTNPSLGRVKDCYNYINKIVKDLGDMKNLIHVVHMNKTLPRNYMKQDHSYLYKKYQNAPTYRHKNQILRQHIQKMDPHLPFEESEAVSILECIQPEYCVYETNPNSIYELSYFIKKQNQTLGISYK